MAAAYAYVLPSVDEPFPMTVLEAMAAGKPVIVTDSNGLAGAVRDYGAGIVVPGDSAQALVEAMQRLVSEPTLAERMAGTRWLRCARSSASTRWPTSSKAGIERPPPRQRPFIPPFEGNPTVEQRAPQ